MRTANPNGGSSQYCGDLRICLELQGFIDETGITAGKLRPVTVNMLDDTATHRDVEQLGASADAQYRCVFSDSSLQRVQTELISILVDPFLLFSKVNLRIKARVNISATKIDDGVHLVLPGSTPGLRGGIATINDDWTAASVANGLDGGHREIVHGLCRMLAQVWRPECDHDTDVRPVILCEIAVYLVVRQRQPRMILYGQSCSSKPLRCLGSLLYARQYSDSLTHVRTHPNLLCKLTGYHVDHMRCSHSLNHWSVLDHRATLGEVLFIAVFKRNQHFAYCTTPSALR